MAAELGMDVNTGLHVIEIGALIWVGVFQLGGMAKAVQQLEKNVEVLSDLRIRDAEDRQRMNAIDDRMMQTGKRYDEAIAHLGERISDVGRRNDTLGNAIIGRLDAINNIVSGHTAQLNHLPRGSKD